jgi:hypothetical protein
LKWIVLTLLAALCLLLVRGKGPHDKTLKDFGGGLRYEQWTEQGFRTIIHAGFNTAEIVVPGDVPWCRVEQGFIIGEKASTPPPVAWMSSPRWECHGFFLLDRRRLDFSFTSGAEGIERALNWFETKEELKNALRSARAN